MYVNFIVVEIFAIMFGAEYDVANLYTLSAVFKIVGGVYNCFYVSLCIEAARSHAKSAVTLVDSTNREFVYDVAKSRNHITYFFDVMQQRYDSAISDVIGRGEVATLLRCKIFERLITNITTRNTVNTSFY